MGGVRLKDRKDISIGQNIRIDTMYPENIYIGKHVHITVGVSILTHSLDTSKEGVCWKQTKVMIEDGCFIGTNTIICNNVIIGENSIIGAGSVVTKDVPKNEIWAGNPAKFIKKRII